MSNDQMSLRDSGDTCPFEFYDAVRSKGDLVWDEGLGAWIAPAYSVTRQIYIAEDRFVRASPAEVSGERYVRILGPGHTASLAGKERADLRKWWLSLFRASTLQEWRETIAPDVVASVIDSFAPAGRVEIASQYADPLAIRMIAAILGLPWRDDGWMRELQRPLDTLEEYRGAIHLTPNLSTSDRALAATYEVDEILGPFIAQARAGAASPIMNRIWADELFLRWDEDARLGLLRTFFGAGRDSTRTSLVNSFYLIFNTRGLSERLRTGGPAVIATFVEESLRLWGTTQFRARIAAEDTELAGVSVARGRRVVAMNAAANRDPKHFSCPAEIDFDRPNPRQHLAFGVGAGACVGSSFARFELTEGITRLLVRLPDIRVDAQAEPPQPHGLMFRMMSPVHACFTPEGQRAL